MTYPTVNHKPQTISITKTFEKAASRYGTEEYDILREIRNDNPGYKVVVKKTHKTTCDYKGLTYDAMEKYIAKHDDEDGTIMAEFMDLTAKSEEAQELGAVGVPYQEVKDWFYNTYPAIAAFYEKREKILDTAKKKNAQAVAAQKTMDTLKSVMTAPAVDKAAA